MKRLRIKHDPNAENPWENWDGMIPLMMESADYSNGGILKAIQNKATCSMVIRHQKRLADILGIDLDYFREMEFSTDEKITDIDHAISNASFSEISELLDLFRIPNIGYTSRGYSQGDAVDVLIVMTPDFIREHGIKPRKFDAEFSGARKLLDAWAWGDVYGFIIEESEDGEEWDETDSCWGFYGTDFETNGMLDYIPEELHGELRNFDLSDIEYN